MEAGANGRNGHFVINPAILDCRSAGDSVLDQSPNMAEQNAAESQRR